MEVADEENVIIVLVFIFNFAIRDMVIVNIKFLCFDKII